LTSSAKCAIVFLHNKIGDIVKTVNDSIVRPILKSRNGWNTKGYKTTRGVKLKGSYYNRATPVVVRYIEQPAN